MARSIRNIVQEQGKEHVITICSLVNIASALLPTMTSQTTEPKDSILNTPDDSGFSQSLSSPILGKLMKRICNHKTIF